MEHPRDLSGTISPTRGDHTDELSFVLGRKLGCSSWFGFLDAGTILITNPIDSGLAYIQQVLDLTGGMTRVEEGEDVVTDGYRNGMHVRMRDDRRVK